MVVFINQNQIKKKIRCFWFRLFKFRQFCSVWKYKQQKKRLAKNYMIDEHWFSVRHFFKFFVDRKVYRNIETSGESRREKKSMIWTFMVPCCYFFLVKLAMFSFAVTSNKNGFVTWIWFFWNYVVLRPAEWCHLKKCESPIWIEHIKRNSCVFVRS